MSVKMFETITAPLNDKELEIAEAVMHGLRKRVGASAAIKGQEICDRINLRTATPEARQQSGLPDIRLTGERLRKIISHIRRNHSLVDYWVIASNNGYYVSKDPMVVKTEIESLKDRASAILAAAKGMEDGLRSFMAGNQMSIL